MDRSPPRTAAVVFPLLACNARCPFCSSRTYTPEGVTSPLDHREALKHRRSLLRRLFVPEPRFRPVGEYTQTLAEARADYDRLRAAGVERVSVQGGEPTLFEGLGELLAHGRALGFREQIVITNGRRLRDRDFTARLLASGLTGLGLSVFGATEATHDAAMGARHAFDDLLEGVRNLRALGAFERGSPVHCTAQFTLYAGNWGELEAMYRFWRAEGLRSFAVQLLRETDNTREGPASRWFFDLARLKPGLEACLDQALADPGVFFSFSGVFYCLLDPSYLALVLRDVPSNPGLRDDKVQVSRHHRTDDAGDTGARPAEDPFQACRACDLRDACHRPEARYLPLLSGSLRPVRVADAVRSLAARDVGPSRLPRLRALASLAPELRARGADEASLTRLAVRVAAASLASGSRDAGLLLDEAQQRPVRDRLQFGATRRVPTEFRWVDLRALGDGASLAPPVALKARWRAAADPSVAALLAPVAGDEPAATTRLFALFTHWDRRDPAGPITGDDRLVVTTVYDGRHVDPPVLAQLYAALSAPGP